MSSSLQVFLPVYVEGAPEVDAPGRLTVHTGESPGATVTLTTEQATIFDEE